MKKKPSFEDNRELTKFEAMKSKIERSRTRAKRADAIALTDEQKEFLLLCREHEDPVTWAKMAELWEEMGWGPKSPQQLQQRLRLIQKGVL